MKIYRWSVALLVLTGFLCYTCFFQKSYLVSNVPATAEIKSIDENYQAPFNLVYHFYQAVEKNDWKKIKTLVTPAWWAEMHRSGYRQKWGRLIQQDPSINFVMFLVVGQKIDFDHNWAWVMGRVDWTSARQKMSDENETVFFVRQGDSWKISSIRLNLPVEVVDKFYENINSGDFRRLPSFISSEYWRLLTRSGIIASLKADWAKNKTGVYCVFNLDDFGIDQYQGWVKGTVLWNPLTSRQRETPVTIFLSNTNSSGWKINKINGHWQIHK